MQFGYTETGQKNSRMPQMHKNACKMNAVIIQRESNAVRISIQ